VRQRCLCWHSPHAQSTHESTEALATRRATRQRLSRFWEFAHFFVLFVFRPGGPALRRSRSGRATTQPRAPAARPARGRERSAAGPAGTRGIRARGGGTDQLCSLYFPTLYQTAAIYYCFTVCRAPPLPHAAADVYTAIMVPNRKTTPTDCRGSVRSVECQRERSFVRRWPHLLVQPKGANVCPLSHL
jgi:hypothetical protein